MDATLIDFADPNHHGAWEVVNDGVMGGLSQSEFIVTEDSTAVFRGTVSLENFGGFASVRTRPGRYGAPGFDGLEIDVRGDGQTYSLRLRMDDGFDGIAYQTLFATEKGPWMTIRFDWKEFSPSFRGRVVPDAPPLDPTKIRRIGFLISEKQEGPFRLEIARITAFRR